VNHGELSTNNFFLLSSPFVGQVHGKSKMNKSFAEERNIDYCPALNIASVFVFGSGGYQGSTVSGSLVVQRSDENGGVKTYTSIDDVRTDYQDGSLHPGDLKKHAMIAIVVDILDTLSNAIKADKDTTQAAKTIKSLLKKKK
jgi:hypothetical protein